MQGGGGNVSWKDEDCLWVKASGTSIADAMKNNIFVPVDLKSLAQAITSRRYDEKPVVLTDNPRRASIETMFHVILPQKYVVHLHEVNSLSHLVGNDAKAACEHLMPEEFKWAFVSYHKPGAELAEAIHKSSTSLADLDFVFLENHGIIVAHDKLEMVSKNIETLSKIFEVEPRPLCKLGSYMERKVPVPLMNEFSWVIEPEIAALAIDPTLLNYVKNNWVLYPDHAVFLGSSAYIAKLMKWMVKI